MKIRSIILSAALSVLCIFGVCSCGNNDTAPSADAFSEWIKAYSGDLLTSTSVIRVESNSPVAASALDAADYISLSPSAAGEAVWMDDGSALAFVPEAGALKEGRRYTATARLDKLYPESGVKKFSFQFTVAEKKTRLAVDRVLLDEDGSAAVAGRILFSEPVDPSSISADLLSVSEEDVTVEVSLIDEMSCDFLVSGLDVTDSDYDVEITLDATSLGFKKTMTEKAVIPANDSFRVVSAVKAGTSDPYIEISFSSPLKEGQNLKGLVELDNVGKYYFSTDHNILKVFYEDLGRDEATLNVYTGVRNADSEKLAEPFTRTIRINEIKPQVKIPISGSILPDPSKMVLPFKSVGLAAVDVSVVKVFEKNVLYYLQDNDLGYSGELRRFGRLVYKNTVRLDQDPDLDLTKWQNFSVDLSGLVKEEPGAIYRVRFSFRKEYSLYGRDGSLAPGALDMMISASSGTMTAADEAVWDTPYSYYDENPIDWSEYNWDDRDNPLTPSYYMRSERFPSYCLTASSLGLVAKRSDDATVLATVFDINSAAPVAGADVTVYNYQIVEIGRARTDASGFATIPVKGGKPFIMTAASGSSTTYMKVSDGEENSLSRFDTSGKTISDGLKGFVYGERGVWRPGDTVHLILILEDKTSKLPGNHPVVMEIYTPEGRYYNKQITSEGKDGFYRFDIKTAETDPTGAWNAYFTVGNAVFHKLVQIETVKPNRLKIDLSTPEPVLKAGGKTLINLSSNWLTGPAASGLRAKVDMTLRRYSGSPFKGYEKYTFSNPLARFETSESTVLDTKLDAEGKASVEAAMPKASNAPGMLRADLVANVFEQGGDASIWTSSMKFSPYSSYVGINLGEAEFETDKDLKFPVAVVGPEGDLGKGSAIEYRIWKLDWSWWWDSAASELYAYGSSESHKPVVEGSCTLKNGKWEVPFRIDYPDWGRFLITVEDLSSGHLTGGTFIVDWPSWRGRSDKENPDAVTMLTFSTDRKEYEVGDEATVYIPGAVEGSRALVSLENAAGVLGREVVRLSKAETQYKIRITPEMAPNFYVHITLVQPYSKCSETTPVRLYGVQPVFVVNKASHLEPVVSLPEAVRPEEKFTVKVSEKNGRPMTYTLAIVDEGLLDLTNFKTPDAWNSMYAREALGVRTWDMYDNVVGAYSGKFSKILSIGGDDYVNVGNRKENRFNPVVEFLGPFTLTKGTAKHDITLPMYVGSVRVMLVAGHEGAYGKAETAVPARSPLLVLPTLPRRLGTSEKVSLPVNVFAMENGVKDVSVTVRVEGPAKVDGASSKTLSFSKPGDKIVGFALTTGEAEGFAKVTVKAEGGGFTATETIDIEVLNPSSPVTTLSDALIEAGSSESFKWAPFDGGAENYAAVSVSTLPTIDFKGIFNYFNDYPYNCSEQVSSKLLAYLYAGSLMGEEEKISAAIPELLATLYSRQLSDGGFAYWPSYTRADEWGTTMVGEAMIVAASRGYEVPKSVMNGWKNYEKRAVRNYRHISGDHLDDLLQANRLYALALAGEADAGAMNRLRESDRLSASAKWRLAAAYALAGKKNIASEIVASLALAVEDVSDPCACYWTPLRDKAILLETLIRLDENAKSLALAKEIAGEFSKSWYDTQRAAYVAKSMALLSEKISTGATDVEIDGTRLQSVSTTKTADLKPSKGSVEVRNLSSDGPVYASLLIHRKPSSTEPVSASSNGMKLSVSYTRPDGSSVNPSKLSQGTDFIVKISVSNTTGTADMKDCALRFTTPSGWEIFNDRLFGGETDENVSYKDIRDDSVSWYFDLPANNMRKFEIRCQASYEGTFVLPGLRCEAMYNPEYNATTASSTVSVVK
ncbi:MAG: MG2 domain-containing protein [Bacteroidales bacterium]|nr:MG2 domain-containing protein [Bacteroidales bacterium]